MSQDIADSTVALTAYNILAVTNGAMTAQALHRQAEQAQLKGLEQEQMDRALNELFRLGRVMVHDGLYACPDKRRRVVVTRLRNDVGEDEDGNITGGWQGWRVRALVPEKANPDTLPLDEVLQ